MNVGEANHVNQLLRWLLDVPGEYTGQLPTTEVALGAARALAERANSALHTGITAAHVDGAWPALADLREPAADVHDPGPVPEHDPADTRPLLARQLEWLHAWAVGLDDPDLYKAAPGVHAVALARVLAGLAGVVQQLDARTSRTLEHTQ